MSMNIFDTSNSGRMPLKARRRLTRSRWHCILRWCELTQRDWRTAAERLGAFVAWLRHSPSDAAAPTVGPGLPMVRGPGRINRVLAAVRGFLRHSVAVGNAPAEVLAMLL